MKIRGMKERFIIGLAWEGTYEEAENGGIHKTIEAVKNRMNEINEKVNESELIGVSIHDRRDGFIYYVGWEVAKGTKIPSGMADCVLPEGQYFIYRHKQGENIETSYTKMKQAIQEKSLTPLKPEGVDSVDELPIKVELHSLDMVLKGELEFEIHIPVVK